MLAVPHPYPEDGASTWISTTKPGRDFAVTLRDGFEVIGAISIEPNEQHRRAALGYWCALTHWGRGYMTEAVRAVIDDGFRELALNRIHAECHGDNPASRRVLEKAGMTLEGCLRQHSFRLGRFADKLQFGILHDNWTSQRPLSVHSPGMPLEPCADSTVLRMLDSVEALVGEAVEQIWVWGPIRLIFNLGQEAEPAIYTDVQRFSYTDADGSTGEFDASVAPAEAGPVLALLNRRVTSASASGGTLNLRFDDGSKLRALPNERYQSWSVVVGERVVQCLPGGELGTW